MAIQSSRPRQCRSRSPTPPGRRPRDLQRDGKTNAMIRIFSILVGLFFTAALAWSFGNGAYVAATEPAHETVEHAFHKHPKDVHFASDGALGRFDRQQLQRGFAVYKEVCANCHSLRLVT